MQWLMSLGRNAWLVHSARTALAGALAVAIAQTANLPEAYWAPISKIIVMQSTLGAAWSVSKQRLIGIVLGAACGALLAGFVRPQILTFGVALFLVGLICVILHLDQSAYRFAGVTLAIVMLAMPTQEPWLIGLYRFGEMSLGIAVSLGLTAPWPARELPKGRP